MFEFLKKLFRKKSPEVVETKTEILEPGPTVNPAPKYKKPKAPKNPPKPAATVVKIEEAKSSKKRGRPSKPKA